jgi:hypothetical protein
MVAFGGLMLLFLCFQIPCKECGTLFVKRGTDKHKLCNQCNNLRRRPPLSEKTTTNEIEPLFPSHGTKHGPL